MSSMQAGTEVHTQHTCMHTTHYTHTSNIQTCKCVHTQCYAHDQDKPARVYDMPNGNHKQPSVDRRSAIQLIQCFMCTSLLSLCVTSSTCYGTPICTCFSFITTFRKPTTNRTQPTLSLFSNKSQMQYGLPLLQYWLHSTALDKVKHNYITARTTLPQEGDLKTTKLVPSVISKHPISQKHPLQVV